MKGYKVLVVAVVCTAMLVSTFFPAGHPDATLGSGAIPQSSPSVMNASVTSLSSPGYRPVLDASSINEPFNSYSLGDTIKNTGGWSNWNGTNGIEDFSSYSTGAAIDNTGYWNNWDGDDGVEGFDSYGTGATIKNTSYWNNWDSSNIGYEGFSSYGTGATIKNTSYWNNWDSSNIGYEGFGSYTPAEEIIGHTGWTEVYHTTTTHSFHCDSGKGHALATTNDGNWRIRYTFPTASANPPAANSWVEFKYTPSNAIDTLYPFTCESGSNLKRTSLIFAGLTIFAPNWTNLYTMTIGVEVTIRFEFITSSHVHVWINGVDKGGFANDNNWGAACTSIDFDRGNPGYADFLLDDIKTSWTTDGPDEGLTFVESSGKALWTKLGSGTPTLAPKYTFGTAPSANNIWYQFEFIYDAIPTGATGYYFYGMAGSTYIVSLYVDTTGKLRTTNNAVNVNLLTLTVGQTYTLRITQNTNTTFTITVNGTPYGPYTNVAGNTGWTTLLWLSSAAATMGTYRIENIITSWTSDGPDEALTFIEAGGRGLLTKTTGGSPTSTPTYTFGTAQPSAGSGWVQFTTRWVSLPSGNYGTMSLAYSGMFRASIYTQSTGACYAYDNATLTSLSLTVAINVDYVFKIEFTSTTQYKVYVNNTLKGTFTTVAARTTAIDSFFTSTSAGITVSLKLDGLRTSWTCAGPDTEDILTFNEASGKARFSKVLPKAPVSYPIYTFGSAQPSAGTGYVEVKLTINATVSSWQYPVRLMSTGGVTITYLRCASGMFGVRHWNGASNTYVDLQAFSVNTQYTIRFVMVTTTTYDVCVDGTLYNNSGSHFRKESGTNAAIGKMTSLPEAGYTLYFTIDDISTSWTSTAPSYHSVSTFAAATDHGSTAGNFSKNVDEMAFSYPRYNFTTAQANAFVTVGYLVTPGTISSTDTTGLQVSLYGTGSTAVQQTRFTSNGSLQILDNASWRTLRSWTAGVMYNITIYKVNATKYDVLINETRYTNGGSHYTTAANTTKTVTSAWLDGSTFATGVLYIDDVWMADGGIPLVQVPKSYNENFESYALDADIRATGGWNSWDNSGWFTFKAKTNHASKRGEFSTASPGAASSYPTYTFTTPQSTNMASVGYILSPSYLGISSGTTYFYVNLLNGTAVIQSLRLTGVGLSNAGNIQVKDDATWRTLRSWTAGIDYNITVNFVSQTTFDVVVNGTLFANGMAHYTKQASTLVTGLQVTDDATGLSTVSIDNVWMNGRYKVRGTFDVHITTRCVDGSTGNPISGLSYSFKTNGTSDAAGTTSVASLNQTLPFSSRDVGDWDIVVNFTKTGYTNVTRTTCVRVWGLETASSFVSLNLLEYTANIYYYYGGGVHYMYNFASPTYYKLVVNFTRMSNGTLMDGTSDIRATDGTHVYTNTSTTGVLVAQLIADDFVDNTPFSLSITCHKVGMENATFNITCYVDTVAPTVNMAFTPAYSTNWINASTTFTVTGSDAGSGLDYLRYNINSVVWNYTVPFTLASYADGPHYIYYMAWDHLGLPAYGSWTPTQTLVYLDKTTTSTSIAFTPAYGTDWVNSTTTFTLSAGDGSGSGVKVTKYKVNSGSWTTYSGAFTLASYGNGTKTIYYNSTDNVGNVETTSSITVRLDMIAATTTILFTPAYGSDWVNGNTTFTLSANDNAGGSGIVAVYYTWNGSWQLYAGSFTLSACLADGAISITYRARDQVGNVETNNTLVVYLDRTTAVTAMIFTPAYGSDWVNSTTTFTLTADDMPGSGVVGIWYRFNGTWVVYSGSFTLTGMANGTYTIEYYSVDNVGNVETISSCLVLLDTIDAVTMLVYVPEYGSDWVNVNTTFTLTPNDNAGGSGVSKTWYRFNGTWIIYASPFTLNASLVDGSITIEYYSVDHVGNVETMNSVNVQLDFTDAVTSLIFTPAHAPNFVTNLTSFTLSASDIPGSGVAAMYYRFNGSWELYSVDFLLAGMANGTYTIEYYSVDNVGNVETISSVVVRLDSIGPTVTIVFTPHVGNQTINATTSFTLSANDNAGGCGVEYGYYKVNGTRVGNYTVPFKLGSFGVGWWLLACYYVDNVGNTGVSNVLVLLVRYNVSIVITSDADWALYASSGNGSAGNPWVVTGYNITAAVCVNITNTTEHAMFEDSALFDSGTGLYIGSASNITINNCTFDNCTLDIVLSAVDDVAVQESYFPEAIAFVAGGGSTGISFDRNFYQDYFNRYPYDVTLNTTTDILESNYTIATGIVDDNPRYHAPWYDAPRSIYIKYFTSLDHQGLPFYQVDTWIDGEAVATESSIVNVFMFRLTTSYVGINVNITDQMVNYNYSRNLRIDLKMAPTTWINNYTFPIEVDVYAYGMLWTAFTIAPQQAFGPLRMAMGTYTYEVRYLNSTLLYNQSSVVTNTTASWAVVLWSDVGVSGEIDNSYVPTDLDRLVYILAPALLTIAIGVIVVATKRRSAKVLQRGKSEPAKRPRRETSVSYVKG